jgi:hypothetical protein
MQLVSWMDRLRLNGPDNEFKQYPGLVRTPFDGSDNASLPLA